MAELKKHIYDESNGLYYTLVGDYYIPDLKLFGNESCRNDLLSCEFNIDTGCMELRFADGSRSSIDCSTVENKVADNMYQRSELDWLIYNAPLEYADFLKVDYTAARGRIPVGGFFIRMRIYLHCKVTFVVLTNFV